eukprot:scaffold3121_cov209-Pinguiococcus_pyrenoidosus.AAC.1
MPHFHHRPQSELQDAVSTASHGVPSTSQNEPDLGGGNPMGASGKRAFGGGKKDNGGQRMMEMDRY